MPRTLFYKFMSLFLGLTILFAGIASAQAATISLDPTFGNGGIVTTDFTGYHDYGLDVELQSDGRIIVVGSSSDGTDNDFALARYNPDGLPDTTFGTDGKTITDITNSYDLASAVVLQ